MSAQASASESGIIGRKGVGEISAFDKGRIVGYVHNKGVSKEDWVSAGAE